MQFEEVIQEFTERQKRKVNLIIFGVDEERQDSITDSGPKEHLIVRQSEKDKSSVNKILSTIDPNYNNVNLKIQRLGRFVEGSLRPRPLRVTLNSELDVLNLLRTAKVLKNNDCYKNLSLSSDRTPRQISHYKQLKEELAVRTKNGEGNLRIRYFNGSPKIVNLN